MGRLAKQKRQLMEQANKRLLGEDIGGYTGTFGSDDNTFPWISKKNQHNPSMEDYGDEEETFDTFDDWKASSYYNDPDSRWDINRPGHDDSNKNYFDIHRDQYGPFRVRKEKGGLKMGDIVSSLRDQLTKATGKTFSPEQIAAKLKELKDEQAARDSIDPEEIEMWRDRKR